MVVPIPPVLSEIVDRERRDVGERKQRIPRAELMASAADMPPARPFVRELLRSGGPGDLAVIAEIKRRSPSAGLIRPEYAGDGFRPEDIARTYHRAGARAISCLTNEPFFGGALGFLERVKSTVPLPVLRKEFIIDPWQIAESRAAGADAVLLIAECLSDDDIRAMLDDAAQLGLGVLLEAHEPANFERCLRFAGDPAQGGPLIGINNRDLRTMRVDLGCTEQLAPRARWRSALVSESGIRSRSDAERVRAAGVRIILVGEHLMRHEDPGEALRELIGVPAERG